MRALTVLLLISLITVSFSINLKQGESIDKYGYSAKLVDVETFGEKGYAVISINYSGSGPFLYRVPKAKSLVHRISDESFLIISADNVNTFDKKADVEMTLDTIKSTTFSKTIDFTNTLDLGYYKISYLNSHFSSALNKYDSGDVRVKDLEDGITDFKVRDNRIDTYYDSVTQDSIIFEATDITEQNIKTYYFLKLGPPKGERFFLYQKKDYGMYSVIIDKIDLENKQVTLTIRTSNNLILKTATISKFHKLNTITLPNRDNVTITIDRLGAFPIAEETNSPFADLTVDFGKFTTKPGYVQLKKGESLFKDGVNVTVDNFYTAIQPPKVLILLSVSGNQVYLDLLENKNLTQQDAVTGKIIQISADRIDVYSHNWTADIQVSVINPNLEENNINVKTGWNMVFVPYRDPVISGCDFSYSKSFIYSEGMYKPASEPLKSYTGFWFKSDHNCKLQVSGYKLKEKNLANLYSGWNFFGVIKDKSLSDFNSTCKLTKPPYYYNPETKKFVEATDFKAGLTYAVNLASQCLYDIG